MVAFVKACFWCGDIADVKKKFEQWENDDLFVLDADFYLELLDRAFKKAFQQSILNFTYINLGWTKLKSMGFKNLTIVTSSDVNKNGEKLDTKDRGGKIENYAELVAAMTFKAAKYLQCTSVLSSLIHLEYNAQYQKALGTSYARSSGLFTKIDRPTSMCERSGCAWVTKKGTTFYRTCSNHK